LISVFICFSSPFSFSFSFSFFFCIVPKHWNTFSDFNGNPNAISNVALMTLSQNIVR
jgi:hypothetical protein